MNAPVQTPVNPKKLIKGGLSDWEVVIGMEIHAQVTREAKLFSGASTAFGGEPNSHVSLRRRGHAGHAAGHQRGMRAPGDAHRTRAEGADQPETRLRPQELLLSGPAAGLPDQPVQEPDRRRGRGAGRPARRRDHHGRHRAPASGAGRRQIDPRPAPDHELRRPQPLGRGADGDRLEARPALVRGGARPTSRSCAPSCATSAPATATWRRAACAPT